LCLSLYLLELSSGGILLCLDARSIFTSISSLNFEDKFKLEILKAQHQIAVFPIAFRKTLDIFNTKFIINMLSEDLTIIYIFGLKIHTHLHFIAEN
jgi:hypothetical protein